MSGRIPAPDMVNPLVIRFPEDRPFMVDNYRDDCVWFFATREEALEFQALLMKSDPNLSGWVGIE